MNDDSNSASKVLSKVSPKSFSKIRSKISPLKKPSQSVIIYYFCTHFDQVIKTLRKSEFRWKRANAEHGIPDHSFSTDTTIHKIKPVLTLNKPIYVGFTALELSKWLMYDFHDKFIKKEFDANLLFTDTGSLTYEFKSEDVYEEF